MRRESRRLLDGPKARSFDVICAGEALWNVATPHGSLAAEPASMQLRPGGGAVNAALALAQQGLRVGLATVLTDDTAGRALVAKIAAAGVDTGGVELAQRTGGLFFVEGGDGARQVVTSHEGEQPVEVPEGWSSRVLLLSGMSPVVSHGAALCKAARAARRAGTVVVVDVNVRWRLWRGHDPRAIRMVLREADVVWCSAEDLFGLNMDLAAVRAALRETAVLAVTDGAGGVLATGPFGEVAQVPQGPGALPPMGEGDAFTAAICAELARAGHPGNSGGALWARALARGRAAASARSARR